MSSEAARSDSQLIPAPTRALSPQAAEASRARARHARAQARRKRTLSTLSVLAVGGFIAAYIGPLGSLGSPADAAEPAAVSLYSATRGDAQELRVASAGDAGVSLDRDSIRYTVYVRPKPTPTPTVAPAQTKSKAKEAAGGTPAWSAPFVTPDPGSAQAIAYDMVLARGWGDGEFSCLVSLWNRESGWRVNALNRSSGAYGIPQSLPGSKMASAGADWETNPATQISWGLGYISGRYGSPCGAWGHSQARGWY